MIHKFFNQQAKTEKPKGKNFFKLIIFILPVVLVIYALAQTNLKLFDFLQPVIQAIADIPNHIFNSEKGLLGTHVKPGQFTNSRTMWTLMIGIISLTPAILFLIFGITFSRDAISLKTRIINLAIGFVCSLITIVCFTWVFKHGYMDFGAFRSYLIAGVIISLIFMFTPFSRKSRSIFILGMYPIFIGVWIDHLWNLMGSFIQPDASSKQLIIWLIAYIIGIIFAFYVSYIQLHKSELKAQKPEEEMIKPIHTILFLGGILAPGIIYIVYRLMAIVA